MQSNADFRGQRQPAEAHPDHRSYEDDSSFSTAGTKDLSVPPDCLLPPLHLSFILPQLNKCFVTDLPVPV